MKSKLRRLLPWCVGLVVVLVVVGVAVLPRLVDPESYRRLLRSHLEEQLGREVAFGAMSVSLWPVLGLRLDDLEIGRTPTERFDKPVVADSLRVGARLLPLLRGRLEVTSVIAEGPVLTLYRASDGSWEPALTAGADPSTADRDPSADARQEAAVTEQAPLLIEQLRVTRGRVVLRGDDSSGLRESTLDDLTLDLTGLGTGGPIAFDLKTGVGASAKLRVNGNVRPTDAGGTPLQLSAQAELADLDRATLRGWFALLVPTGAFPEGLLDERAFSSRATIDYTGSQPARLEISEARLQDLGLRLVRSASGAWNFPSSGSASDAERATEPPAETSIHIAHLTIENSSIRIEDRSVPGDPAAIELSPLRVEVRQPGPDAPIEIDLVAKGGIEGRAGVTGRWSYQPETPAGAPTVRGKFEATGVDPRDLRLATTLGSFPAGIVVGRSFGLSAEIDATLSVAPEVTLRNVSLSNVDFSLERDAAGSWNASTTAAATPVQASPEPPVGSFRVEGFEVLNASLRVTDRSVTGAPVMLGLSALRLSLDRLPTSGPATLALEAQVEPAAKAGKLTLRGKIGPLADDPAATPVELSLKLGPVALEGLRSLLPVMDNLDVSKADAAADLRLAGSFTSALNIDGEVSMSNASVSFPSPTGDARTVPFDLRARGKLGLRSSGTRIELPGLELELPRRDANRTLTLRGSVDAGHDPLRIDLELLPTRVAADDLAALLALVAPDAPLAFASPDPVELTLHARGALGADSLPELSGQATLSGFTFRVSGMAQPMERVGARVALSPNQVTLEGLGGVIGKSDITGSRVVVTDFVRPRIQLDLRSGNADFWELFSFVESAEPPTGASPAPAAVDDPLTRLTIDGTLRIAKGTLQTLAFEQLTATMDFRAGVLTLSPLEMNLYGGKFAGKLVQDLNEGVLSIQGEGIGVDADGFLAQNLELGGLISGHASTKLDLQVRAADPSNALAGVSGGGSVQVVDGRMAKLDVLQSLSRVTGIFGERSLQRLTKQLATADTPFRRAETRLRFDSGMLNFEDLVLETAELTLAGSTSLDSVSGKLDGRFVVALSPELSATMREEQSRAASLFWDTKVQAVSFGFGVSGPATAPTVKVDWDRAVRGVAERELGGRLRALLEKKLGSGTAGSTSTASPEAAQVEAEIASPTSETAPAAPGLLAEVTTTRWTGPVLLRDLSVEGNVQGTGVDRASLAVVDARGNDVLRVDRLELVAAAPESTLAWRIKIDGKRLVTARFPVTVTVTVHDSEGRSSSASRAVNR